MAPSESRFTTVVNLKDGNRCAIGADSTKVLPF
jgi:hypothetical protein